MHTCERVIRLEYLYTSPLSDLLPKLYLHAHKAKLSPPLNLSCISDNKYRSPSGPEKTLTLVKNAYYNEPNATTLPCTSFQDHVES